MGPDSSPKRVLDPVDRFSEIVFGLIMVLTFTCTLGVTDTGRADVRDMIVGALGCNLAWAIIDAAFYLIGVLVERGYGHQLLRRVRGAEPELGRGIVADALPQVLADALAPQELERARALIAGLPEPPAAVRFDRQDATGALAVFLLVFLSTFPVVLPFFFVGDVHTALRISNAVAIFTMFGVSWKLAQHAGLRPLRTAAAMVAIGGALVGVAIALGG